MRGISDLILLRLCEARLIGTACYFMATSSSRKKGKDRFKKLAKYIAKTPRPYFHSVRKQPYLNTCRLGLSNRGISKKTFFRLGFYHIYSRKRRRFL